ncbi:hypothetical protein [Paenibacillus contaminans]|uniref:Uncharacterized protein n=1 Tax=Paenibacillus contaminans TaxID=450362 RepID=A0A329MR16_9BACL|nr:hypothetical protein [Paenibacillus contaminans]RAV20397.1 hypothetical protein DQG23_15635 [Paenibacillus contaminans]
MYRVKKLLQAGVFGLQVKKESRTRFQLCKFGLQRTQATSEEGAAPDGGRRSHVKIELYSKVAARGSRFAYRAAPRAQRFAV